jgi:hypothetical protein
MSKQDEGWPSPVKDEATEAGAALRQYQRRTGQAAGEAVAFGRVMTEVARPRSRRRGGLALATVGTAALSLVLWRWHLAGSPALLPVSDRRPAPLASSAQAVETVAARPLDLSSVATPLPTGKLALPTGVTGILDQGATARARFQQGTLDIALVGGRIELHVPARELGQAVLLTADRFHFTVVGTAFALSLKPNRVELVVSEGLVAVSRDADHLATVAPGETWTGSLPASLPQLIHPAPRIVQRTAPSDCSQFSVEQGKERVACYRELAKRGGREGERAQHALARYLRDDVVDLSAALSAFEAQRSRFPRGELKADADRAIIGLLPRLGRHAEALVETQSFLDAQPDAKDRAEIRLFRGDIYRAIFQDLLSAEREYDEGAGAQGRTGDDSRFLRALCLEALGRMDEARVAYQEYLAQAGTAHTREAQRRMERLSR